MAANPETLARIDGRPLLSEEGMMAIDGLLAAHIDYDQAETMHSAEIIELGGRINELEAQRTALVAEAQEAVDIQHQLRHNYAFDTKKAVDNPNKSKSPVYATVLKAVASDDQMGLWSPSTLEAADEMGQSLVGFDIVLRSARKAQPALVIDIEKSGHTGVYIAKTKRSGRLSPATMPVVERRDYRPRAIERDALALPVDEKRIIALQLHPNSFGNKESLADYSYGKGPKLRELADSFKILLPRGYLDGHLTKIGSYDLADTTADIELAEHWGFSEGTIEIAVGKLAVSRALAGLRQEFARNSTAPSSRQQLAFDQLTQLAFGDIRFPKKVSKSPRRVATNFS